MNEAFRVLVSDKLSQSGLAPLIEAEAVAVDIRLDLTPEQLLGSVGEYDALMVRSATQVDAQVIEAGKRLQVIARAGVGVDNIDVDAATQAGIIVVNAPTGNVTAAAEHTIAMLMAMARMIPQADKHVREGSWSRGQFMGSEIRNKVLGVVGLGKIAQEVVKRAQGLGMEVLASDPYVSREYAQQHGVELLSLDDLLPRVDYLTVHVPLTAGTRGLIGAEQIERMRPGVRLLNVARGGIIDETALVAALEDGRVAGAALDVFTREPLPPESPLRCHDRLILTPHLGGSTVEAQEKVAEDVALQVLDVLQGRPARYAVNAPILPPKALNAIVPYIDLAERMGRFLKQLDDQGIERLEVSAHGPIAEYDLDYIVAAAIKGVLADVVDERVNLVNAYLLAQRRGIEVIERKITHHHERYENMLTIRIGAPGRQRMVRGAVLHDQPNLVAIDDLWVDFPAEGHLLLTSHNDRPGIIGSIGTLMGERDINISFMHVGRKAPRGEAIMVLGTDDPIPNDIGADISRDEAIRWVKAVYLGP